MKLKLTLMRYGKRDDIDALGARAKLEIDKIHLAYFVAIRCSCVGSYAPIFHPKVISYENKPITDTCIFDDEITKQVEQQTIF